MGDSSKYPSIIKYMMLEEIRMQAAMIGRFQFIFFSVFIGIFAFILAVLSPLILETTSMREIYFLIHLIIIAYGLGVGAFGLFADQIMERRFGEVNFLITTPSTQPMSFRTAFLAFYIKDVIYYLVITIIPLIGGLALATPFTSFRLASVLFLGFTITLSFLLGISFSFFISTVYVRSKVISGVIALAIAAVVLGSFLAPWYGLEQLIPTLMFHYTGNMLYLGLITGLILAFSAIAVRFIKVEFGKKTQRYEADVARTVGKFGFAKRYANLMAKEWLDIKRSETLYPIMGAYIGPLIFLWFTLWFLRNVLVLPIHFNVVFYSGMIGLFSVTIYSWLNNTDAPDFYQVLPVTVPRLIRTKMLMFVLLTYVMSAVFLVVLAVLNSELHLLWLGLLVSFITITYTLTATAYLTGLRTNVYLFDARVLGKFSLMIIPPLVMTIIASFMLSSDFIMAIAIIGIVCIILVLSALLLYRGIDGKWARESFVI